MKTTLRLIVTAGLTALLAFFTFGFMETFEPMPQATQWTWRAIYTAAAVVDFFAFFFVWRASGKLLAAAVAATLLLLAAFVALVILLDWSARCGSPV
jgi:hypothetical protein